MAATLPARSYALWRLRYFHRTGARERVRLLLVVTGALALAAGNDLYAVARVATQVASGGDWTAATGTLFALHMLVLGACGLRMRGAIMGGPARVAWDALPLPRGLGRRIDFALATKSATSGGVGLAVLLAFGAANNLLQLSHAPGIAGLALWSASLVGLVAAGRVLSVSFSVGVALCLVAVLPPPMTMLTWPVAGAFAVTLLFSLALARWEASARQQLGRWTVVLTRALSPRLVRLPPMALFIIAHVWRRRRGALVLSLTLTCLFAVTAVMVGRLGDGALQRKLALALCTSWSAALWVRTLDDADKAMGAAWRHAASLPWSEAQCRARQFWIVSSIIVALAAAMALTTWTWRSPDPLFALGVAAAQLPLTWLAWRTMDWPEELSVTARFAMPTLVGACYGALL